MKLSAIQTKITFEPGDFSRNDSKRIQKAIGQLAKEPLDADGFRGAILLKKGRYKIENSLSISHSGIVLRGEGDSEEGTVLVGISLRKCMDEKPYFYLY